MATSISSAFSTGQDDPPGITAFSFLPFANAAADFVDHLLQVEAHAAVRRRRAC